MSYSPFKFEYQSCLSGLTRTSVPSEPFCVSQQVTVEPLIYARSRSLVIVGFPLDRELLGGLDTTWDFVLGVLQSQMYCHEH